MLGAAARGKGRGVWGQGRLLWPRRLAGLWGGMCLLSERFMSNISVRTEGHSRHPPLALTLRLVHMW